MRRRAPSRSRTSCRSCRTCHEAPTAAGVSPSTSAVRSTPLTLIVKAMFGSRMSIRRSNRRESEYPYCTIFSNLGISVADSPAGENRHAPLDKGLRRFPVVLGAAGLHLVGGFHIEHLS